MSKQCDFTLHEIFHENVHHVNWAVMYSKPYITKPPCNSRCWLKQLALTASDDLDSSLSPKTGHSKWDFQCSPGKCQNSPTNLATVASFHAPLFHQSPILISDHIQCEVRRVEVRVLTGARSFPSPCLPDHFWGTPSYLFHG
jgi:hypothetical protein